MSVDDDTLIFDEHLLIFYLHSLELYIASITYTLIGTVGKLSCIGLFVWS